MDLVTKNEYVTLDKRCRHCGERTAMRVKFADLKRYSEPDSYVQDCFPYLSAADRELLLSATCGTCWDRMFKPLEDDETEEDED
jgi:hypothetical protein